MTGPHQFIVLLYGNGTKHLTPEELQDFDDRLAQFCLDYVVSNKGELYISSLTKKQFDEENSIYSDQEINDDVDHLAGTPWEIP